MDEEKRTKGIRILFLYTKLLNGQTLRKRELTERFNVDEKTIQRDLETIREFLDSESIEKGHGPQLVYDFQEKGYRLENHERLNLSNAEILAVSKILLDSRAFTKPEMMSILERVVENCTPKENQKLIKELLRNEQFHYVELQHHKVFLDMLMPLGQAIKGSRVVHIKYEKLKGRETVERRLEPLAILFSEYYFYLVGFIENIDKRKAFENPDDIFPTIYRIDRIAELNVLDEHFKIPYADRFEEGEFRKRVQFMYGGKLRKVRFRYLGESVEAVLDRLPTARIIDEEDGKYVIEAEVFGKGIDMWLKSQGEYITDCKVV